MSKYSSTQSLQATQATQSLQSPHSHRLNIPQHKFPSFTSASLGRLSSIFLFFDSDLLFPRIRASQASFKAVLIAVYMTNGLQTKCKTCFGGPRMILHAL